MEGAIGLSTLNIILCTSMCLRENHTPSILLAIGTHIRAPSLTFTGSRRALDDGVPATLVILAFLSPLAPDDAAEPALAAAAFLFFSITIFARLSKSVDAGAGKPLGCTDPPDPPGLPSTREDLPMAPSPGVPNFTLEEVGGEVFGGLGDRLLFGCCSLWVLDAAVVSGAAVALVFLLNRLKTLRRYSSSAVRTSTTSAGLSSTCRYSKQQTECEKKCVLKFAIDFVCFRFEQWVLDGRGISGPELCASECFRLPICVRRVV